MSDSFPRLSTTEAPSELSTASPGFSASARNDSNDGERLGSGLSAIYDPVYLYSSGACVLIIGLMGIVGNLILLCVMKRPHLKNKSYAHFLSALAVSDTVNIFFQFFNYINYMVKMNAGYYLTASFHNAGCKIYDFVERIFLFNSAWLIVCITVERFLVIYFPCRGRIFCRAKKALTVVVVVCVASCCSQVVRLAWVVRDRFGLCSFKESNATIATGLDIFFEALLFYVVPSFTILILNVLTLIRMNGFIRSNSSTTVTTLTNATGANGCVRNSALYAAAVGAENGAVAGSPVDPLHPQQQLLGGGRENCTASTTSGTGAGGTGPGGVGGSGGGSNGTHQLLLKYFPRLRRNSRRATWILLTISFTYLLCCLPNLVGELYWHVKIIMIDQGRPILASRIAFLNYFFRYRFILRVFKMINYSSNFYTYMLFGKSFRKEVTTLLNFSSSGAMGAIPPMVNVPGGGGAPGGDGQGMMRLPGAPGLDGPPPDLLIFHKQNGKTPPHYHPLQDYHHFHIPEIQQQQQQQQRYRHMPEFPI